MSIVDRWLLPDGIEEILPPDAAHLEAVRRRLLDAFASAGYELVVTPMVEYLESLLTGTGGDLDLKTFKVTDQVSGRMMGVRADITPQVARIDAHSLGREEITRLCYAGTVLHAIADNQLASRSPVSVGAELFGDTGRDGDIEIVSLMVDSLQGQGISPIRLELGDVGIFRDLMTTTDVAPETQEEIFALIQRKATAELAAVVDSTGFATDIASQIKALPSLCGKGEVLEAAAEIFSGNDRIGGRLVNLAEVSRAVVARFPDLDVYFDLSELRGYAYHTGIVFAAYPGGVGKRLAKGGRYDDVGRVFGRARAATGFDIDLKALAALIPLENVAVREKVAAPKRADDDEGRWQAIQRLRQEGYAVVENDDPAADKQLRKVDGEWQLTGQKK